MLFHGARAFLPAVNGLGMPGARGAGRKEALVVVRNIWNIFGGGSDGIDYSQLRGKASSVVPRVPGTVWPLSESGRPLSESGRQAY
jgi:hypothetical protein